MNPKPPQGRRCGAPARGFTVLFSYCDLSVHLGLIVLTVEGVQLLIAETIQLLGHLIPQSLKLIVGLAEDQIPCVGAPAMSLSSALGVKSTLGLASSWPFFFM